MKQLKTVPFFKKIIFYFSILIFCCVTISGWVSRYYVTKEMTHTIDQTNLQALTYFQNTFDRYYQSCFDITTQLSFNSSIGRASRLTKAEKEEHDPMLFKDIIQCLKSIQLSNKNIDNIWIHLQESDTVISQSGMYPADFHLSFYDDEVGNIVHNNVEKQIPFGYQFMLDNKIVLASSIPNYKNYPNVMVYMEVNMDSLFNYINKNNENLDFPYYIMFLNPDNKIILKKSTLSDSDTNSKILNKIDTFNEEQIRKYFPEKEYVATTLTSNTTHYSFITFVPTAYIHKVTQQVANIQRIVGIIQIGLSILFAYLIMCKLYRPVKQILHFIQTNYEEVDCRYNDIDLISHFIEYLFKEKKQLECDFANQNLKMQKKLLCDIVSGQIKKQSFYQQYNDDYFHFRHNDFIVLTILLNEQELDSYTFYDEICKYLDQIDLSDKANASVHFFSSKKHSISALLNLDANIDEDFLDTVLNRICAVFKTDFPAITYTIGIGNLYHDFNEIRKSYNESSYAALAENATDTGNIIYIDKIFHIEGNELHFSLNEETQLRNLLKGASWDDVYSFLMKLMENKNFTRSSVDLLDSYFISLLNAVIRVQHELHIPFDENTTIFKDIVIAESFNQKQTLLLHFVKEMMDACSKNKSSKNAEIYQKIIHYIQENYTDDISLTILSHNLKLSVPYLSHIFKQSSGELFVDYVNKYRLEKAKELMINTDMLLNEIATNVGFLNPNSFNRTFKKYEGITPGNFRKLYKI